MATNKRKDAAALFELIDKSTLKVPKNSGSLKIPKWWSSKSNPATSEAAPAPSANGHSTNGSAETHTDTARATVPEAQPRLFAPPPQNASPMLSPSIRPPSATAGKTASPSIAPPRPTIPAALSPVTTRQVEEEGDGSPRVFAPQTHPQSSRSIWSPPRAGAFARLPTWIILSAIGAVILIIVCIVIIARPGSTSANPGSTGGSGNRNTPTPGPEGSGSNTGNRANTTPENPGSRGTVVRGGRNAGPVSNGGRQNSPVVEGKVFPAGQVARTPELFYVVARKTFTQSIATEEAAFLAKNGFDCSVEKLELNPRETLYHVMTAQGFPSKAQAESLQAKIVSLGRELPKFKRSGRAQDSWNAAEVMSGSENRPRFEPIRHKRITAVLLPT